MGKSRTIIKNLKSNVKKNSWMSFATILVICIVFAITSFFVFVTVATKRAISYYEQKAQITVYFEQDTPETEIFAVRDQLESIGVTESILYTSEEQAVKDFVAGFPDQPELYDVITVGTLPPSLDVKANDSESLAVVLTEIKRIKDNNAYIEDIWYYEEVIEQLQVISKIVRYGGATIVGLLSIVTFVLIIITIGFNIKTSKEEIEIMKLVGGSDSYIKGPFILGGAFYGFTGSFISALILLVPWYGILLLSKDTALFSWLTIQFTQYDLGMFVDFHLPLILSYLGIVTLIGTFFGVGASWFAVIRYLNQDER